MIIWLIVLSFALFWLYAIVYKFYKLIKPYIVIEKKEIKE